MSGTVWDMDAYPEADSTTEPANLSIGQAAHLAGISTSTLKRWDAAGIFVAHRTPTNRRRYRRSEVLALARRDGAA